MLRSESTDYLFCHFLVPFGDGGREMGRGGGSNAWHGHGSEYYHNCCQLGMKTVSTRTRTFLVAVVVAPVCVLVCVCFCQCVEYII